VADQEEKVEPYETDGDDQDDLMDHLRRAMALADDSEEGDRS
jgi:hypothetical protein